MAEKRVLDADAPEIVPVASDEEVIYEGHVDPRYWRSAAVASAASVVCIPFMPLILPLVWAYSKSYRVYLTRTAIKIRSGICNITNKTIPLDRVTDVTLQEGCIDRCFDYTALIVHR